MGGMRINLSIMCQRGNKNNSNIKMRKNKKCDDFLGLIDGRNMFPEGSLIFSVLLVGGFDVPLFNMHLSHSSSLTPNFKNMRQSNPILHLLTTIPFKIAQYFFLPIYRSHCACALRDCRLIVHTITGVCWIFH